MVHVKVCGITNPEDARLAAGCGADAIGIIFARSPRRVSVEEAQEIVAVLPDGVLKVGVFVDTEPAAILRIASEVGLDRAQLHGDESPDTVTAVRHSGLEVIKA